MNASAQTNLKVPFAEKDQAKALGARWNAELKTWYVPQGLDTAPFQKWFSTSNESSSTVSTPMKTMSKPALKGAALTHDQSEFDENDFDAINAQLRDAYEPPNLNEF